MTINPDEGHTGLDRDNNQRPDVNQDGSQGAPEGNPAEERWQDLTDAAKESGDR